MVKTTVQLAGHHYEALRFSLFFLLLQMWCHRTMRHCLLTVMMSGSDSSWVLSPEQLARHVSPVTCRDRVAVMEMADIERLMTAVSKIRR